MAEFSNAAELLERYGVKLTATVKDGEVLALCPFHTDTNPSCGINIDKQVFNCLSCGAHGDLVQLLAGHLHISRNAILRLVGLRSDETEEVMDPTQVEQWHQALLGNKSMLDVLLQRKGITKATCKAYGLGLRQNRVTIPIYDGAGEIVNVRCWSPTNSKQKMTNVSGHGRCRVYPHSALESEKLLLVEGELKALLLRQLGVHEALSLTGGSKTWDPELGSLFAGKIVYIIYDIDKPGVAGAHLAAQGLIRAGATAHVINLPLDINEYPTGGVDEYILKVGKTPADLSVLLQNSVPFQQIGAEDTPETFQEPLKLHLGEASRAEHNGKLIECNVVVSAKDTAPYIVPRVIEVVCPRDKDMCLFCPRAGEKDSQFTIHETDSRLLELVAVPSTQVNMALKQIGHIPAKCYSCKLAAIESQNVEELRLIPQLKMTMKAADHVVRRAFFVGYGIEPNTAYTMTGRVVSEPKSQYATLLIIDAKPAVDSLSTFVLKDPERLKIFQPETWTTEGLTVKLDDIYADLESNVTQIYQRRDMHLFYDLVYHSPLYMPFQGRIEKGWVEGLVLGDSGQGKSEAIKRLQDHYQVGEKIDTKGSSVAGLLGGLQETNKRWFVTWGIIPLNDRRLVVLEEVKGMDPSIIAKLTDMRSSGIAEISKIEKTRTNARTRLIWISNARSDRQIMAYNFGIEAIRELIGSLEDIRRFDLAITVASGEVPKSVLNMAQRDRPQHNHIYKSDECRDLILWAWSRTAEQIKFSQATVDAILVGAGTLSEKFVSSIPLVEPADQRLKLARLAASLAARTFSTEDYDQVLILPCHVAAVVAFLESQYSKKSFGYLEYSKLLKGDQVLQDEEVVIEALRAMPYAADVARQLLEVQGFTIFDIMAWTELDRDQSQTVISVLARKNAIKRGQGYYIKTPAFIALLRRLDINKELSNESLENLEKAQSGVEL